MVYIFLGIIIGIAINRWISPIFDILLEEFVHKRNIKITKHQLAAQALVREHENKYPNVPEENQTNAIGFRYEEPEEYYDDYFEDKGFGFRKES